MATTGMTGGQQRIGRQGEADVLILKATLDATPEIDMTGAADLLLFFPNPTTIGSLTLYAAPAPGKTYRLAPTAIRTLTPIAGEFLGIPSAVFPAGAIKLVADVEGPAEIAKKG